MAGFDSILGLMGLTTRGKLGRAVAKQKLWHSLVRDVFAQYYLKLREPFPNHAPALPHRYSSEWEGQMRSKLEEFLKLDTASVSDLLATCGFGTEKWDKLKEDRFSELRTLIEEHITGEMDSTVFFEEFEAALAFDPTEDEVKNSTFYKRLEEQVQNLRPGGNGGVLEDADDDELFVALGKTDPVQDNRELLNELKAKEHAIERLQAQLEKLGAEPVAGAGTSGDGGSEQQIRALSKKLKAREHTIETLHEQLQALENSQPEKEGKKGKATGSN